MAAVLVVVYSGKPGEAQILKGRLAEAGIPGHVPNFPRPYAPSTIGELLVPRERAEEAAALIARWTGQEAPDAAARRAAQRRRRLVVTTVVVTAVFVAILAVLAELY